MVHLNISSTDWLYATVNIHVLARELQSCAFKPYKCINIQHKYTHMRVLCTHASYAHMRSNHTSTYHLFIHKTHTHACTLHARISHLTSIQPHEYIYIYTQHTYTKPYYTAYLFTKTASPLRRSIVSLRVARIPGVRLTRFLTTNSNGSFSCKLSFCISFWTRWILAFTAHTSRDVCLLASCIDAAASSRALWSGF